MKFLQSNKKWLLAAVGLLVALLILKIILFLTAKPKITVDYVAEYNRISRPENYDPNDNAAPYYQKAFDAFVEMPYGLERDYNDWPTDCTDTEQAKLESWITSNSRAFEYFREALNKPYFWIKRTTDKTGHPLTDKYMGDIKFPDMAQLRQLTEALLWDAKLKAAKGKFKSAFENIIGCYRAGNHKCDPNLCFIEQYFGLDTKQNAIQNAFIILDKPKADNKALKFLQDALQKEFDNDNYIPGCEAEKLYEFDQLQRIFIYNGRGTGRLAWRIGFGIVIPLTFGKGDYYERKMKISCFTGPTKNQAVERVEQSAALFSQIMVKTPWQIENSDRDYFKEIENIYDRYLSLKILEMGFVDPVGIFHAHYKTRAQIEALIAVLAILRFEANNNRYPVSLEELVSAGYLKSVPMDPYSDGSLIYKPIEGNFTLYSVGENFVDDSGSYEREERKDAVEIWGRVTPSGYSADIVYWPYKSLPKPRNEKSAIKRSEKQSLPEVAVGSGGRE